MQTNPINILIRTSNRPDLFHRCMQSVLSQTQAANVIVSYDDDRALNYLQYYKVTAIRVSRQSQWPTYWNLYLNDLIRQANGFCFILDDDDFLKTPNVVKTITTLAKEKNKLYCFKMQWPNTRVIPGVAYFGKTPFTRGEIGMPCVVFHSDLINKVRFDGYRAGDYRFFNRCINHVDKVVWCDFITVETGNTGLNGQDIKGT